MNSPTSVFHAPRISVSCIRSFNPSLCITLGRSSAVDWVRSGLGGSEGRPRHSAMTARRRDGVMDEIGALEPSVLLIDSPMVSYADLLLPTSLRRRRSWRGSGDRRGANRGLDRPWCGLTGS